MNPIVFKKEMEKSARLMFWKKDGISDWRPPQPIDKLVRNTSWFGTPAQIGALGIVAGTHVANQSRHVSPEQREKMKMVNFNNGGMLAATQ